MDNGDNIDNLEHNNFGVIYRSYLKDNIIMIVSQRDNKWSGIKVGSGDATIGQVGCTITCLGYCVGMTPDKVNEAMKRVGGYQVNLVIWSKTLEAIGVKSYRYTAYDNTKVLEAISNNGACLVEVDAKSIGGTGRHWVVFTGNKKCQDPWTGTERPTTDFTPTGYATVEFDKSKMGNYQNDNSYKGIDLTNTDSVKICVDVWFSVMSGDYIKKIDFESQISTLTQQRNEAEGSLGQMVSFRDSLSQMLNCSNKNEEISGVVNTLLEASSDLETVKKQLKTEQEARALDAESNKKRIDELVKSLDDKDKEYQVKFASIKQNYTDDMETLKRAMTTLQGKYDDLIKANKATISTTKKVNKITQLIERIRNIWIIKPTLPPQNSGSQS